MTDYVIAAPNGGTWGDQLLNNATVGRYHELGFLSEGAAGASNVFKQARPGILPGPPATAGVNFPGAFAVGPTSGLGFSILPGAAILERTTLSGAYHVQSTAVGAGAVGTADPTQTRIDLVSLEHFDGALGDNSSTTLTRVRVKAGTPGGGVPAQDVTAGARAILGWWTIPATTTTLTGGMWTDNRKSAAVRGATRVLLPGDALSDPGFVPGERRQRYHATYGWMEDLWDPSGNSGAGLWRGTQVLPVTQPTQTGSGTLSAGTTVTIATVTIADPGWPYHIVTGGMADFSSLNTGDILQVSINVNSAVINTSAIARGRGVARAGGALLDQNAVMATANSRLLQASGYTGAQILDFVVKNAGSGSMTIFNGTSGDPYVWGIEIVPAGI